MKNKFLHLSVFVLVLVFTFATVSCRHKDKKNVVDSVPKTSDTLTVVDTVYPMPSDTVASETKETEYIMKRDSAVIRNLRLFTRKQKVIYSPDMLVGEWVNGTEHEIYFANGTGKMWDTSEDVSRDEAQEFEWSLDSNLLTVICRLKLGGVLPKRYVVTFVDDENLEIVGSECLFFQGVETAADDVGAVPCADEYGEVIFIHTIILTHIAAGCKGVFFDKLPERFTVKPLRDLTRWRGSPTPTASMRRCTTFRTASASTRPLPRWTTTRWRGFSPSLGKATTFPSECGITATGLWRNSTSI